MAQKTGYKMIKETCISESMDTYGAQIKDFNIAQALFNVHKITLNRFNQHMVINVRK
jgi:hypothetical protein